MKSMAKSPLSLFLLLFVNLILAQTHSNLQNERAGMSPDKSIVVNTQESENHKTLIAAVRAADLDEILNESGPFTVFAPSDVAFDKISEEKITQLLHPANKEALQSFLTYHIVAGKLSASSILRAMSRGGGKASFTTVQGNELIATMDGIDIVLTDKYGNTAKITTADANQCNGVIHVIDSVLPNRI